MQVELQVRRLKYLQRMVRFPQHHVQPIAAVYAQEEGYKDAWLLRVTEDLRCFEEHDDFHWCCERVMDDMTLLFTCEDFKECFLMLDVAWLRAKSREN